MKKVWKVTGIIALAAILLVGVVIGWYRSASSASDETFVPYLEEALREITAWKMLPYNTRLSRRLQHATSPDQWSSYMAHLERLGTLESIGEPERRYFNVNYTIGQGQTTTAVYLVPLEFDMGPAHAEVRLVRHDGRTKIDSIHFYSDLLLGPPADSERDD